MPYFLTKDQYAPGSLYITDASLDLVKQWCEATGERLRCYFVDGYVDSNEIDCVDEYPDKYRLSASQMRIQIEEAQRRREADRQERERDGEPTTLSTQPLELPNIQFASEQPMRFFANLQRIPSPNDWCDWAKVRDHGVGEVDERE